MNNYQLTLLTILLVAIYGPAALLKLRHGWHNTEIAGLRNQIDRMAKLIDRYESDATGDRRTVDKLACEVVGRDAMLATCRSVIADQRIELNELRADLFRTMSELDELRANTAAGTVARWPIKLNQN